MTRKMRTGSLMIVIAFLCAWMGLPFEWLTPQGQLQRRRAERFGVMAAEQRTLERRARSKGDLAEAEQSRLQADRFEQQVRACRKASLYHWKWPELKPGGARRAGN